VKVTGEEEEEEEKEEKKKTAIIKAKQTHTQKGTPSMSEGPPSAKRKCGL